MHVTAPLTPSGSLDRAVGAKLALIWGPRCSCSCPCSGTWPGQQVAPRQPSIKALLTSTLHPAPLSLCLLPPSQPHPHLRPAKDDERHAPVSRAEPQEGTVRHPSTAHARPAGECDRPSQLGCRIGWAGLHVVWARLCFEPCATSQSLPMEALTLRKTEHPPTQLSCQARSLLSNARLN